MNRHELKKLYKECDLTPGAMTQLEEASVECLPRLLELLERARKGVIASRAVYVASGRDDVIDGIDRLLTDIDGDLEPKS